MKLTREAGRAYRHCETNRTHASDWLDEIYRIPNVDEATYHTGRKRPGVTPKPVQPAPVDSISTREERLESWGYIFSTLLM